MFQIGINIDNEAQKPAAEIAPGYDFTELPVGEMLFPFNSDAMWAKKCAQIKSWPIPPLKASSHFLDGFGLVATGSDADWAQVEFWTRRAFARLADVGIEVVGVYGDHFFLPEGFSKTKVIDQALKFCALLADCAAPHGMKVALEPNANPDTLWPRYLEGVAFAKEINRPEICAMADLNYFLALDQPLEDITQAPELCVHCHVAGVGGQPGLGDLKEVHTHLFRVLRDIGYERGVSAACPWVSSDSGPLDIRKETAKTLRYLQGLREKVYSE